MNTSPHHVTGHEVAQLLREVITGRLKLCPEDPAHTWRQAFCGLVGFRIDGWRLQFFNDCASLDYCDNAESPDGRTGTFQAWYDAGEEPVSLLNDSEQQALAELFDACS